MSLLPLILVLASLGVMIYLVLRRWPQITLLDADTIPEAVEEKKKEKILRDRAKKQTQVQRVAWARRMEPLRRFWQMIQARFRAYVSKVQRDVVRAEHKKRDKRQEKDPQKVVDDARQWLQQAEAAVRAEEWDKAEEYFIRVIQIDPKHKDAYRGLGQVYLLQKQYAEAKETYGFLHQLDPADDSVLARLGEIAEAENDISGAVEWYEKSVLLNPNAPGRFARLADLFLALNQPETAREAILQAVELEPENPRYLDNMIEIGIMLGDAALAEEGLRQLRTVNPENQKIPIFQEKMRQLKKAE